MSTPTHAQILASTAYLIALLHDKSLGIPLNRMPDETSDALLILTRELTQAGLLARYRQPDGSLGLATTTQETRTPTTGTTSSATKKNAATVAVRPPADPAERQTFATDHKRSWIRGEYD